MRVWVRSLSFIVLLLALVTACGDSTCPKAKVSGTGGVGGSGGVGGDSGAATLVVE